MSYHGLPKRYPGMYRQNRDGKWVPIYAKNKKDKDLCIVKFCTRVSEKATVTNKTARSLMCPTCRLRLWRANNPIKAIYNAIKNKARRRGIPFSLSLEKLEQLCDETDFHLKRGRRPNDFHIDRIDASRGYEDDNVRIITASENCSKAHTDHDPDDNCPF